VKTPSFGPAVCRARTRVGHRGEHGGVEQARDDLPGDDLRGQRRLLHEHGGAAGDEGLGVPVLLAVLVVRVRDEHRGEPHGGELGHGRGARLA
jgi:hypothetical protein